MTRGSPGFLVALAAIFASIFASVNSYAAFGLIEGECITGGKEATAHSRPYMASLQFNKTGTHKHECGGFLVSAQWVMTAAHCLLEGVQEMKVVLGAHSLTASEDSKEDFTIDEYFSHSEFNSKNYDNDIALLKLDRAATLGDSVKTVEFQRDGAADPQTDDTVSTAGWGSLNNLSNRPDKLQEVDVEVLRRGLCSRSDYYGDGFTSNLMCASAKRKDTCDGDSGGPLLFKGVVVGITSNGGKKCGTSRKPGLYTIISHYTAWIDSTMQK